MTKEGVVQISQAGLIALQKDAQLLKRKQRVVRSRLSGNYVSLFKGRGMEFDEARPYQPGDDIRNMDWRVTARTNKPHSKVFREERERPVLLWVDYRTSMFFGTQHCFKSVQAAKVAALLAWQASQQGDRLGALMFTEHKHLELRPGRGKAAALHVMKQLSEFSFKQQKGKDSIETGSTGQDAEHALNRLSQVTRPGSLIYLISDFRNCSSQLESTMSRLSRHNELVIIHLFDPLEEQLPAAGFYRVSDGETETEINATDKVVREHYHSRFTLHQENLKAICKKTRARFLPISTSQPLRDGLMKTMPKAEIR